jgi:hypothetical protein
MTFGELLDGAFTMYRRYFRALLGVAVVCYLPFQAIRLYISLAGGWAGHFLLLSIALLISSIGAAIGAGATLKVISDGYLDRSATMEDALRFAMGRVGGLIVAGLARGILIVLGVLLLLVPGLILAAGYAVVAQVVVLEDPESPLDSLGRSWFLTKGFRMRALGLGIVLTLVTAIPAFAATLVSTLVGLTTLGLVIGSIATVILSPLVPCGLTLYYYDLRVRKEAFDLQTLDQLITDGAPA